MTEIETLRQKHADVFDNAVVENVAFWKQPNSDDPVDEEKYQEKTRNLLPKFIEIFEESRVARNS